MRCPFCQAEDTRVIETRANDEQGTIRRRRECQDCHRRFTTYERHEEPQLYVIKKDGRRELFDREKLLNGITRACEKRSVSREAIEQVVYDIERSLRDVLTDEVPTRQLGDMVMQHLRDLDEVAYVRFASVYKEFRDLGSFMDEIQRLFERGKCLRMEEGQTSLFES
ncbi:MAG TPA: transcriptional regulator NrdR [Armatimonadota bacterium]|nr:transcriptional regulator NrdR [Armatimonadota bacterium]